MSNINVLFPPLQDPNEARFYPTFRGARSDLAVWIDEYFLGFPTMPAAIAGLGINGIESANGKLIKQRAAEAEEQRLEVAKAAKAAEELELSQRLLLDKVKEALERQGERDVAKAKKLELSKQRKAQEFKDNEKEKQEAAQKALAAGLEACKVRYGYKGQDNEGGAADHFDQGFMISTTSLSDWTRGAKSGPERVLQPLPAVLVLSLLSMELDMSKPFEFKPNEWTWLSNAMDSVHAVIALRIRAVHQCAMMCVLSALKYFVDSVPYAIGETQTTNTSAPPTVLITGFIITAAKSKKHLDEVITNANGQVMTNNSGLCLPKDIFMEPSWNSMEKCSPVGTFDAYTFRPDAHSGEFGKAGSATPEFLALAHYLRHRYTHNNVMQSFCSAFCFAFNNIFLH